MMCIYIVLNVLWGLIVLASQMQYCYADIWSTLYCMPAALQIRQDLSTLPAGLCPEKNGGSSLHQIDYSQLNVSVITH